MNKWKWLDAAIHGWQSAEEGDFEAALNFYREADKIGADNASGPIIMNPELSILRHKVGEAEGLVVCPHPTEDEVVGAIEDICEIPESDNPELVLSTINANQLRYNLGHYRGGIARYHLDNLKQEIPHLQVLSTGRCGTISLLHLFSQSQYVPYHQCQVSIASLATLELMCRHIEGRYEDVGIDVMWAQTRAAEWIGPTTQGRPVALLPHTDTIYAPLFSRIHPLSKFIYLHRNPEDVFKSFWSKGQWGSSKQGVIPCYYSVYPFEYRYTGWIQAHEITWYIKFTEVFSRAFGETMGDRFIEISADKLFQQDKEEIEKLRNFTEINLSYSDVKKHFKKKINEKAHKVSMSPKDIEAAVRVFRSYYDTL
jgi:hypothetical protein